MDLKWRHDIQRNDTQHNYRLRRRNWHYQPLVFKQVGLVGVVADQILQGVELATADVKIATDGRYSGEKNILSTLEEN